MYPSLCNGRFLLSSVRTAISGILSALRSAYWLHSSSAHPGALLAHGGLALGANIISMGVMGPSQAFGPSRRYGSMKINLAVSGFVAVSGRLGHYFTTSIELASGIKETLRYASILEDPHRFHPTQLPLGILEGAMTAGMIVLLYKNALTS